MKYRITIEESTEQDDRGYENWRESYQQIVPDIDIGTIVNNINQVYSLEVEPPVTMSGDFR